MNFVRRVIEDIERNTHDILARHGPRQPHQKAIEWTLAPIGEKRPLERLPKRDAKLMASGTSNFNPDDVDPLDGSPGDDTEAVGKNSLLARTDARLACLE